MGGRTAPSQSLLCRRACWVNSGNLDWVLVLDILLVSICLVGCDGQCPTMTEVLFIKR